MGCSWYSWCASKMTRDLKQEKQRKNICLGLIYSCRQAFHMSDKDWLTNFSIKSMINLNFGAVTNQSINKRPQNLTEIQINKESWFWNSYVPSLILRLTLYFPRSSMTEYTASRRKQYWQELCWQQWLAGDREWISASPAVQLWFPSCLSGSLFSILFSPCRQHVKQTGVFQAGRWYSWG